ncbi:hypothetical protein HK101_004797 [Irineochytrium annulatum]|nr:hypothetical protein HK101_004797 [Irineochytrium annulatum]
MVCSFSTLSHSLPTLACPTCGGCGYLVDSQPCLACPGPSLEFVEPAYRSKITFASSEPFSFRSIRSLKGIFAKAQGRSNATLATSSSSSCAAPTPCDRLLLEALEQSTLRLADGSADHGAETPDLDAASSNGDDDASDCGPPGDRSPAGCCPVVSDDDATLFE